MYWYIFISFFYSYLSQELPEIFGSACIVSEDKLHVVGGFSRNSQLRSELIYSIDIEALVQGKSPKWQTHPFDLDESLGPFFSGVSLSKNTALITEASPIHPFFKIQELDFDSFSYKPKPTNDAPNSQFLSMTSHYLQKGITITRNDIRPNEYIIHSGGIYHDKFAEKVFTYSYDTLTDKITPINYTINDYYFINNFHSVAIYKGIMYVIGSYNEFIPTQNLIGLNLDDKNWNAYKVSGDIPKKQCKFSYEQVNNLLYATGGEYCVGDPEVALHRDTVYVLNLDTRTWEKHKVDNFKENGLGCLVHYNGYLVNAFGYLNINPVQVIDINTWSLITSKDTSTGLIIGLIIGAILILLIALFLFWYFRRKKNSKFLKNSITDPYTINSTYSKLGTNPFPNYVTDHVWIQHIPYQQQNTFLSETGGTLINNDSNIFKLQCKPEFQDLLEDSEQYSLSKIYTLKFKTGYR